MMTAKHQNFRAGIEHCAQSHRSRYQGVAVPSRGVRAILASRPKERMIYNV